MGSLGEEGNFQITCSNSWWVFLAGMRLQVWRWREPWSLGLSLTGRYVEWTKAHRWRAQKGSLLIFLNGAFSFPFSSSCNIIPLQRWLSLRNGNRKASSFAPDLSLVGISSSSSLPEAWGSQRDWMPELLGGGNTVASHFNLLGLRHC